MKFAVGQAEIPVRLKAVPPGQWQKEVVAKKGCPRPWLLC